MTFTSLPISSAFFLFADDTNLLYADKNLKSLEAVVDDELMKVCEWLNANKLSLNTGKSNFDIFHPYQHKAYYDVNLKTYDNSLQKSIPHRSHFIQNKQRCWYYCEAQSFCTYKYSYKDLSFVN